ncbi:MAG: hypothetical protein FJY40_06785 [Betaproteobacteria bacterium]|nr:hypothetical protein [Betaproteobacteria bacterium]
MAEDKWEINAGWEVRGKKSICRWFVCWRVMGSNDTLVGALAGFSGGGSFEVERFYGKLKKKNLASLWVDFTDRVSDEEIEFDSLDESIRQLCESALDQIWEWNDNDVWSDTDEVVLRKDMKSRTAVDEDMLLFATAKPPFLKELCGLGGLTAAPK